MISSRSAVAIHLLTLLAMFEGGEPLSSGYMAGSVNTNAVVVRRVLGALREAGLVRSQEGSGGGWYLARSPREISLLDAYLAVEGDPLFSLHNRQPNPACPVGKNIGGVLEGVFGEAESAMERRLAETTVAGMLEGVVARGAPRAG